MPDMVATVKPGEVLALGFNRSLTMAEARNLLSLMQPFQDRGIEVVIITEVCGMIVSQPVDNPVETGQVPCE